MTNLHSSSIILHPSAGILVVKLADLGDVLTATPALRALREAYPQATIDLLLTHHIRAVFEGEGSPWVDNLIPSDNFRFFSPKEALKPGLLREGLGVLNRIRREKYDAVLVLHHLSTRAGALKYAAIAQASGAKLIAGLKPPGNRGRFLTHAVPDGGFGARHEIDYWLAVAALLGAKTDRREPDFPVPVEADRWAEATLSTLKKDAPLVVIHPGSGGFSTARRWPAEHFAAVADALAADGAQIALVGTASDGADAVSASMQTTAIDLSGETSLHQLAALLNRASLFIGGDSGVSHLAAACAPAMVSIFGPTNAAAWGATGDNRIVLQADIPCAPCAYVEYGVGLRHGCEAKTCLKLITPDQVIAAARMLLAGEMADGRRQTADGRRAFPQAEILGVRVQAVTAADVLAQIEAFIAEGGPHQVCTVNAEFVIAAQHDAVFRQIINRAALAFPDGAGLIKAANWLNQPRLPERIPGVDTVESLAKLSAQKGYRIYFLGAMPGVAEIAIAVLQRCYPGMVVAGAFAGSPRAEDEDAIVERVNIARPDILLVAYGHPRQDKWIARNLTRLNVSVLVGVGGTFDFISGTIPRAPQWMQRLNLEWLYRLIRQPSRWRRIWDAVPRFTWLVWRERLFGKKSGRL